MFKLILIVCIFFSSIKPVDNSFVHKQTISERRGKYHYIKVVKEYGYLEIKNIKLRERIYPIGDINNHIDRHIQLLYNDINKDNYVIVGHSGQGPTAYFEKLNHLSEGSIVTLNIAGKTLKFSFTNKYKVEKEQINSLNLGKKGRKLLLLTCDKTEKNKFLVLNFCLHK